MRAITVGDIYGGGLIPLTGCMYLLNVDSIKGFDVLGINRGIWCRVKMEHVD